LADASTSNGGNNEKWKFAAIRLSLAEELIPLKAESSL